MLNSCKGLGQWVFWQGVLLICVTDHKSRCLGAGSGSSGTVNLHVHRREQMLYRFLCNAMQREGAKPNPDLAFGLFCYVPLPKIWYGILRAPKQITLTQSVPLSLAFP